MGQCFFPIKHFRGNAIPYKNNPASDRKEGHDDREVFLMTLSLYTWATPNGHKPQILLEELSVRYDLKPVNIFKGEQLTDEFRRINPNRRIPVLVDSSIAGEPPWCVFESGAILIYLADKFGRFMPSTTRGRYEVIQWVMWQMGGLGPMLGQGQHFWTYATEKHPYSIDRYTKEG